MIQFKERRLGRVEVSPHLIQEWLEGDNECLKILFDNFMPLQTEYESILVKRVITYVGYSKDFDIIEEATVLPTYDFTFKKEDDKYVLQEIKKRIF